MDQSKEDHEDFSDDITLTEDSKSEISPPPDGGFVAWSQAFAGHLISFNSWGFINSFSLFQAYYTTALDKPPSSISWVGSIQLFLTFFIGTFAGRALDAGFYRHVAIAGCVLQILGVFMTSLVKSYWQLILSQGICIGLGNGLVFTPTVALVSTYFLKKRAVAISCLSSGTATGGIIFPVIARQMLHSAGFGWTVRVMGFIILANSAVALALARPRNIARRSGPLVEWAAFADPWFSFFTLGLLLALFGLYFGYYYITPFAEDIIHVSSSTSLDILLVINAVGLPGRLVAAWAADRFVGPLNVLIIIIAASAILTYGWAGVKSVEGTWAFAVLYGIFAAGVQSMFPPALANARKDPSKVGVEMGMISSVVSIGCLCGAPVAGGLIQKDDGRYLYAQMFGGSIMIAGAAVLLIARALSVGLHPFRMV